MRMLRKTLVTDAIVTASNAPSDGIADYDGGTTYSAGQTVVVPATQSIYEALTEVTGVFPPTGATNSPREWRYWRPINEWAMFDEQLGTFTESSEAWPTHTGTGIQVELTPGQRIDTVALLQLDASSVRVEMLDGSTTVFDETYDLNGGSYGVSSWFEWFTVPLAESRLEKLIVTNLPNYPNAVLRLSLEGEPARCGLCLIGTLADLGCVQWGASVGIRDYSIKDRDEWGRPIIVERGFSARGTFDVLVPAGNTDTVVRLLSEYRATPTLWMGAEQYDSTIIFGFYDDHEMILASYPLSELAIDIEGLTNE